MCYYIRSPDYTSPQDYCSSNSNNATYVSSGSSTYVVETMYPILGNNTAEGKDFCKSIIASYGHNPGGYCYAEPVDEGDFGPNHYKGFLFYCELTKDEVKYKQRNITCCAKP